MITNGKFVSAIKKITYLRDAKDGNVFVSLFLYVCMYYVCYIFLWQYVNETHELIYNDSHDNRYVLFL